MGRSRNAGLNSSHERDGKADSTVWLVGAGWRTSIKREGTPVSIKMKAIVVDSGASRHVVGDPTLPCKVRKVPKI